MTWLFVENSLSLQSLKLLEHSVKALFLMYNLINSVLCI